MINELSCRHRPGSNRKKESLNHWRSKFKTRLTVFKMRFKASNRRCLTGWSWWIWRISVVYTGMRSRSDRKDCCRLPSKWHICCSLMRARIDSIASILNCRSCSSTRCSLAWCLVAPLKYNRLSNTSRSSCRTGWLNRCPSRCKCPWWAHHLSKLLAWC